MKVSEITSGLSLSMQPRFDKVEPVLEVETVVEVPIQPLISGCETWITNEERAILAKLKTPKRLASLSEHEQFRIQAMIRKDLVTKSGDKNPTVVANEKI